MTAKADALAPVWTAELPGWPNRAPVAVGDSVVIRAGGALVAFDAASGAIRWTTAIDRSGDKGQLVASAANTVVTTRSERGTTALVGVAEGGEIAWELPTGVFIGDAWAIDGDAVVAFGRSESEVRWHRIDAATGQVRAAEIVAEEPDRLLAHGGRVFALSLSGPGIVELDDAGRPAQVVFDEPVDLVEPFDDGFAATLTAASGAEVRSLDGSFGERWRLPAASTILAAGSAVLAIDAESGEVGSRLRLVGTDGDVLWQTKPFEDPARKLRVLEATIAVTALSSVVVLRRCDGVVLHEFPLGLTAIDVADGYVVAETGFLHRYDNPESPT